MLSYKKIGTGYPLVLIHGYLGGQSMWKFQEELKNDYDLIMPSLAGYGESSHMVAPSTIKENANVGQGILAGVAILFCALILDQVIQGKKKD